MAITPAFGALPGGMEIFVILLIFFLFTIVPIILIIAAIWYFVKRMTGDTDDERVAELQSEIRDLKRRLDERDHE